jgi:hypothetical protein
MASNLSADNFDTQVNDYLNNKYVVLGILFFLILYAAIIVPKLRPQTLRFFNNWVVKIALFFAIVYISTKNVPIALITAVAVLVTLAAANRYELEGFCGQRPHPNMDAVRNTAEQTAQAVVHEMAQAATQEAAQEMAQEFVADKAAAANANQGMYCAMASRNKNRSRYTGRHMNRAWNQGGTNNEAQRIGILNTDRSRMQGRKTRMGDGKMYAINIGAGNMGGCKLGAGKKKSHLEPDYPDHVNHPEEELHGGKPHNNICGVEEHSMDDVGAGSSLDESVSMGPENAGVDHVDAINQGCPGNGTEAEPEAEVEPENEGPVEEAPPPPGIIGDQDVDHEMVEETLVDSVEEVAGEVEEHTGCNVSDEMKQEIIDEVRDKVLGLVGRGHKMNKYDVISVCRELYRKKI